jgi:Holliday junction resolvase
MSGASRRKGLTGEREAADVFEANGWEVRGLESSGDWLTFRPPRVVGLTYARNVGTTLHVEVKRQERLRLPEWLAQAKAEAPEGVPPVVVFRQSRGEWYAALPLTELLGLVG